MHLCKDRVCVMTCYLRRRRQALLRYSPPARDHSMNPSIARKVCTKRNSCYSYSYWLAWKTYTYSNASNIHKRPYVSSFMQFVCLYQLNTCVVKLLQRIIQLEPIYFTGIPKPFEVIP